MRPLVIIESPFAGDVERHLRYARLCMKDSINRGERPFASHLLYPQCLDDSSNEQRALGIQMGYEFWMQAKTIAFYLDLDWSAGMRSAFERAYAGRYICERRILEPSELDKLDLL